MSMILSRLVRRWRYADFVLALALGSVAYVLINYKMLVAKLLYRFAAYDYQSVAVNAATFFLHFTLLLLAFVVLPRRAAAVAAVLVFVSGLINVAYADIMGTYLDASAMLWLLSEARQAGTAFKEVAPMLALAGAKVLLALLCLLGARRALAHRVQWRSLKARGMAVLGVLAATFITGQLAAMTHGARGGEINAYGMAFDALTETYPPRAAVSTAPQEQPRGQKIVWLVDESVAASQFAELAPSLLAGIPVSFSTLDFGAAFSFANCSAQSNAALRWGVDVAHVNEKTDLRTVPTIWAYAKAAGYRTTLIDGQVKGQPQNLLWAPEKSLIDEIVPALSGIDTDHKIAADLNQRLRADGRQFIYVVLRGAHYQYEGNYPQGELPPTSTLAERYRRAVQYSKDKVFSTVLQNAAENGAAVFYTSDHGQIIKPGVIPHCNDRPYPEEYRVPLLLFVPKAVAADLGAPGPGPHHHSQIFPTTLWLMGYSRAFAEQSYDHMLDKQPKQLVKFGKAIVPRPESGEGIQVDVNSL
jgi:glucan phosphoethanolaminetransferase (alkaline phosphatase superfamily)